MSERINNIGVIVNGKLTAAQIEDNCPAELANLGWRIAAHIKQADECQAHAERHRINAGRLIALANEACDSDGFEAFRKKFFGDIGRSRTYELMAIATGKKSVDEIRELTRKRVARHRARVASSVTVTDSDTEDEAAKSTAPIMDAPEQPSPAGPEHPETLLAHWLRCCPEERTKMLDGITVDGLKKEMSDEFRRQLCAKLNPFLKFCEMDPAEIASKIFQTVGPTKSKIIAEKLRKHRLKGKARKPESTIRMPYTSASSKKPNLHVVKGGLE